MFFILFFQAGMRLSAMETMRENAMLRQQMAQRLAEAKKDFFEYVDSSQKKSTYVAYQRMMQDLSRIFDISNDTLFLHALITPLYSMYLITQGSGLLQKDRLSSNQSAYNTVEMLYILFQKSHPVVMLTRQHCVIAKEILAGYSTAFTEIEQAMSAVNTTANLEPLFGNGCHEND